MPVSSSASCDLEPLSPRESAPFPQLANGLTLRQMLSWGHGHDEADLYL